MSAFLKLVQAEIETKTENFVSFDYLVERIAGGHFPGVCLSIFKIRK